MDKILEMKFKSESGKLVTLTLDSPKEDITEQIVKESMTSIIGQNALAAPNDESVVGIDSARVITKTVVELAVA